ncbi:DUF2993 domain-containing protein [Naasia sp. SYSU D00948]|uniref:LmeA family phospholipid-binding protein n=1 Tax=Naasia sp. SYSU D00948 TaxID=2817379 RepID=UPI001B309E61|nr:DUF2993 domain-containing protein [Naasia sp. SYSU D00948]
MPIVLLLVLAAVAVLLVETVGRGVAEDYVEQRVEESLPDGVTGDVAVRLGGGLLLPQYLGGRMRDVRLTSEDLVVGGIPVRGTLRLEGAPLDPTRPVDRATGTVVLRERAVDALLEQQGYLGDTRLGDGVVEYSDTTSVLGVDLDYTVTARPSLAGGRLDLVPQSARVSKGPFDLDARRLLDLVAPDGISICLAALVPDTVTLDSLEVREGIATVDFSGDDVVLTQEALARTGSCA